MEELGSNKEFIDEEIITIICESIKNVFDLTVKFENSETNVVEVVLQNDKEKAIYEGLYYNKEKSTSWCNSIIDLCIKGLIKLEKPYKYVVTCVMLQNTGKSFCSLGNGYFEETDGAVSKTIGINDLYFCVTIYGLSIQIILYLLKNYKSKTNDQIFTIIFIQYFYRYKSTLWT